MRSTARSMALSLLLAGCANHVLDGGSCQHSCAVEFRAIVPGLAPVPNELMCEVFATNPPTEECHASYK